MFSLFSVASVALAAEFKGVTLGLLSVSWNTQLPPAIAQKAGFFEDKGLDVRIITIESAGPIMMALLSSGEADLVISGAVAILRGIASGAPAVVVGSQMGKPDYTLMGAKGLRGLGDLKGKVVGSTGAGSFSVFAVVESLRRKGLVRNQDYKLLPVGGTAVRIAALQTKKIDAAPLSSGERVNVEAEGFPVLLEIGKVLPEFPFTVLAATKKFARTNPDKVSTMLRALDRAIRLIRDDKDKAVQIGKAYGLRGEPAAQRKALEYVADDFEIALKRDQVAALTKVLEIKNSHDELFEKFFSCDRPVRNKMACALKRREPMSATLKYIAYLCDNPENLAKFYSQFFQTERLVESSAGDISVTDGSFNLTFFKKRPALCEPRMEVGLNHIGIQVDDLEAVKNKYLKLYPRKPVIPEAGDVHHGVLRIHDPDGNPVSLSDQPFGVKGDRRYPGIRHIAYNAMDPEGMREFYFELFGFAELTSGLAYRNAGRLNRFIGDGSTNLAIHPFYDPTAVGHEMKFGINHLGFLVRDLRATMDQLSSVVRMQKRPDDRPFAEFRFTDPEGNRLDLSQTKGWEVAVDKWERVAA